MKQRGLTLVEVLVAIAIIGIIFTALAAAQIANLRITSDARAQSTLLQSTVVGFERLRTAVLADFQLFNAVCSGVEGSSFPDGFGWQCRDGAILDPEVDYTILGSEEIGIIGLIEVRFEATQGDRSLEFRQFISCLDAVVTPAFSDPSECLLPGQVLP